jgi:hemolysin D
MLEKPKRLAPEALDFAPGLLAIQESPPARLPRAVMYTVTALFGILLVWACVGKLDIIASAEGRLVPESYVKVVQPADAGIVKDILIREGETVHAGQVLLRMDPQEAQADTTSLQTQLALRSLQLRRIDAELAGRSLQRNPGDPPDLFAQIQDQYRDRHRAYQDSLEQAQQTLTKARHDYDSGADVLSKLRQTNPILKDQADAYSSLGEDGYVPKVMVGDKQRAFLENDQDLHAQQDTVAGLESAVAKADKQIAQTTSKYRSDLQDERVDADTEFRKLQQELAKQEHKVGLLELKAPQAGIVKDLATHTIGTVVSAGTVLLSIVPEHEPLVAEVMIRNDDVGFVHPQQAVKIKLSAYPFQKYGMIDGTVQQVWPDASDEDSSQQKASNPKSQSQTQESEQADRGYKALVSLGRQDLNGGGAKLRLVAGMQVIAEIQEGRRSVLEYLLSPVKKTLNESGHER